MRQGNGGAVVVDGGGYGAGTAAVLVVPQNAVAHFRAAGAVEAIVVHRPAVVMRRVSGEGDVAQAGAAGAAGRAIVVHSPAPSVGRVSGEDNVAQGGTAAAVVAIVVHRPSDVSPVAGEGDIGQDGAAAAV